MLDSFDYRVFLSPNETINSKGALLEKQFVCARVRERETGVLARSIEITAMFVLD